MEETHKA